MAGVEPRPDQLAFRRQWLPQALKLAGLTIQQFQHLEQALGNATAHELVLTQITRNPRFQELTEADMYVLPGAKSQVPRFRQLIGGIEKYQEKCIAV